MINFLCISVALPWAQSLSWLLKKYAFVVCGDTGLNKPTALLSLIKVRWWKTAWTIGFYLITSFYKHLNVGFAL